MCVQLLGSVLLLSLAPLSLLPFCFFSFFFFFFFLSFFASFSLISFLLSSNAIEFNLPQWICTLHCRRIKESRSEKEMNNVFFIQFYLASSIASFKSWNSGDTSLWFLGSRNVGSTINALLALLHKPSMSPPICCPIGLNSANFN